jgi:homoserine O-acetyltransferase/O-succinyltransferase
VTTTNGTKTRASDATVSAERSQFSLKLNLTHSGPTTVVVQYELVGHQYAPLLLVAGGISAGRHVQANPKDVSDGWWQSQSDTFCHHRLLSIDWVGADGALDRPIDTLDQANALVATMDRLGIAKAAAFIGASYGAMVGMHCAAIAPPRIGALLAISAADRAHPFASAQRAVQRQAIELGERLGSSDAGVALARKLAILSYRTPQEFEERFPTPVTIEQNRACASSEPYLEHMGRRHSERTSAAAYRRLSESIDLHRINPDLISVPTTFVAALSDQLVPARDIENLARAVADGRFVSLRSLYGHDAFLKEERAIATIIKDFLNSLEQHQ